jgi:hypothetical protein
MAAMPRGLTDKLSKNQFARYGLRMIRPSTLKTLGAILVFSAGIATCMAQVPVKEARSNVAGWLDLLGVSRVPDFLQAADTDQIVTVIAVLVSIVPAMWMALTIERATRGGSPLIVWLTRQVARRRAEASIKPDSEVVIDKTPITVDLSERPVRSQVLRDPRTKEPIPKSRRPRRKKPD